MLRRALWVLVLISCGDNARQAAPDADPGIQSFVVTSEDGLHQFAIACADLDAGQARSYLTDGDHAHVVHLSADELARLADGETVEVSFTEGHEHGFSIRKPDDACV